MFFLIPYLRFKKYLVQAVLKI